MLVLFIQVSLWLGEFYFYVFSDSSGNYNPDSLENIEVRFDNANHDYYGTATLKEDGKLYDNRNRAVWKIV